MGKKHFLVLMAFVFFNLTNTGFVQAVEKNFVTKYPNYAYTFNGEDKYENFNRKMFNFNMKVNKYIYRPVDVIWSSIIPKYAMERLKNCCNNIEYPKKMVSSLLQKDFKSTGKETARFLINSTIGVGGMFDPAKSKFNIEPTKEDMEQALSKCRVKTGAYLVLPFLPPSNARGYAGKIFDLGLNPSTYFFGIGPAIAKAGVLANKTSYSQDMIKNIECFADPYEVAKKLYGIDNYIKNSNFDRKEVLAKIISGQNSYLDYQKISEEFLKPDMSFKDYNSQSPVVDSMRTTLFQIPCSKKSVWNELSVWNRSFDKKIKSSKVNIDSEREDYRFRYILQKNKNAPVAIIYPSIGEGAFSHHPVVFAKIFYDAGYSVIIQGSPFHWQFVKSAPKDFRPGMPYTDAKYARLLTAEILKTLEDKEKIVPCGKTIVGTSHGGLTALFVGAQEEKENTLNVSRYISISPPVDLFYALKKMDSYTEECNKSGPELQEETAVAASKLMQIYQTAKDDNSEEKFQSYPLTEKEGVIVTNFMMRQKLADLIFTLENSSKNKKTTIYNEVSNMSFNDYFSKYHNKNLNNQKKEANYEMGLYSIEKFLALSDKYKIYEAKDDYFVNEKQLNWLKKIALNKMVLLQNGSHLGFLYRKEFQDSLKKDIVILDTKSINSEKL